MFDERLTRPKFQMKIGIVGHGFVGKAVDYAFSTKEVTKMIIDPLYGTDIDGLVAFAPTVTFVCAPTPMNDDGTVDASIVTETVIKLISETESFIVIKSTVTPDVIDKLAQLDSRVVYNPEFLQEGNAKNDFVNAPFQIMGGEASAIQYLEGLYSHFSLCNPCPVIGTTAVEASYIKYAINSFLAMKVTFFNQLTDIVEAFGGNSIQVIRAISADPRIGSSHTRVPGYDGKQGYGGACLPKDVSAFIKFAESNNVSFDIMKTVTDINNNIRSQYELDDREKSNNVDYGQTEKELKDQND